MKLSDFNYELPKELIAQTALPKRSDARLLVLDRESGTIAHKTFRQIADYFDSGDVLVLNDTKVLPARILAKRKTGGAVEVLVLGKSACIGASSDESVNDKLPGPVPGAKVLLKPSRRVKKGETLILDEKSKLTAMVLDAPNGETGIRHVEFQTGENMETVLDRIGHIPLPPYIDRPDQPMDRELYQTVFAKKPGAVASPTAGLHFDKTLLEDIRKKGVEIVFITLHVSYGTFQPVAAENLKDHKMHEEYYEISREAAERISFAKLEGRRIIACGTTVVRTLESAYAYGTSSGRERSFLLGLKENLSRNGTGTRPLGGLTNLFIYPPYQFKIVDTMITNFHLPRTTLLMLTSAFAGHELLMRAYEGAIKNRYRFFSYGDAMLIS